MSESRREKQQPRGDRRVEVFPGITVTEAGLREARRRQQEYEKATCGKGRMPSAITDAALAALDEVDGRAK